MKKFKKGRFVFVVLYLEDRILLGKGIYHGKVQDNGDRHSVIVSNGGQSVTVKGEQVFITLRSAKSYLIKPLRKNIIKLAKQFANIVSTSSVEFGGMKKFK